MISDNTPIPVSLIKRLMLVAIGVAYIRGLFIPLINNDSAHHANIALTMYETGDFVNLMDRGKDYLDKPHLLFWLSALSYKVFGVTAFAFRLPSFLFSILAVHATFKLAAMLYSKRIGTLSATILATSYGFFLANTDVRMDAILTSSIIFSIWQLIIFIERKTNLSLVLSALGLAMGFATKGAVGIVMPLLAVFFFIAYRRDWNSLMNIRWGFLILLVMVLLSPVFYCFYLQFDLHPEKVIRGTSGNSGISFLLFGQSVQRYSGSGWGTNGADPLFYVHTFLWLFLPWSIISVIAFWRSVRRLFRTGFRVSPLGDHLFIPATIVVFLIILSGSQFKLPHYLNILFPFIAITTARFVESRRKKWKIRIRIIQYFVVAVVLLITIAFNFRLFPPPSISSLWVTAASGILLLAFVLIYNKQYFVITLAAIAVLFLTLNFNVFPNLLELQAGNVLAQEAKAAGMSSNSFHYLEGHEVSNSFDFHVGKTIHALPINTIRDTHKDMLIYTDEPGLEEMQKSGLSIAIIARAVNLRVSKLDTFIFDPAKRGKSGPWHYLIRVNQRP